MTIQRIRRTYTLSQTVIDKINSARGLVSASRFIEAIILAALQSPELMREIIPLSQDKDNASGGH